MLDFSHDLHFPPFIHFWCQLILIVEIVSVGAFLLQRVLVKFSSDCLSTNVRSDCSFVVDKTLNDWNYVGKLCANIDHQTTFQGEKIC